MSITLVITNMFFSEKLQQAHYDLEQHNLEGAITGGHLALLYCNTYEKHAQAFDLLAQVYAAKASEACAPQAKIEWYEKSLSYKKDHTHAEALITLYQNLFQNASEDELFHEIAQENSAYKTQVLYYLLTKKHAVTALNRAATQNNEDLVSFMLESMPICQLSTFFLNDELACSKDSFALFVQFKDILRLRLTNETNESTEALKNTFVQALNPSTPLGKIFYFSRNKLNTINFFNISSLRARLTSGNLRALVTTFDKRWGVEKLPQDIQAECHLSKKPGRQFELR